MALVGWPLESSPPSSNTCDNDGEICVKLDHFTPERQFDKTFAVYKYVILQYIIRELPLLVSTGMVPVYRVSQYDATVLLRICLNVLRFY